MQDKAYKVIKKCKEIAEKDFTKFSALFVAVMTVGLQLPNYIDKRYVMYMINSPTINKSVMKNVQGIGRTRTSLSKLKELLVPIPPYKQQCQISATFDKSLFYFDTINALCE